MLSIDFALEIRMLCRAVQKKTLKAEPIHQPVGNHYFRQSVGGYLLWGENFKIADNFPEVLKLLRNTVPLLFFLQFSTLLQVIYPSTHSYTFLAVLN